MRSVAVSHAPLVFGGPRRYRCEPLCGADVPTLLRFLAIVAVLGGLGFAAVFALATMVNPVPREMRVTIPASKLQGQPNP